jgi:hypothetical protein
MKVSTIFDGGMNKILRTYEKSLANIDKTLDFELNSFAVKVNGIVKKLGPLPKTNFYQRNFKVVKNASIVFPKLITFVNKKSS